MVENDQPRVTGIGLIFFKSKNPDEMKDWYRKNLKLNTDKWGASFEWREGNDSTKKRHTQWTPFENKTPYFAPSTKEFMINYRVAHIEKLVEEFEQNGVTILDEIETYDYGKLLHILDGEGNKIELWEPVGEGFEKTAERTTL